VRRWAAIAIAVLVAWMALLLGLAHRSGPEDEVVVWAPSSRRTGMLASARVSLVNAGRSGFIIVRGNAPDFVSQLYASGAWLVIPARKGSGCIAGPAVRRSPP